MYILIIIRKLAAALSDFAFLEARRIFCLYTQAFSFSNAHMQNYNNNQTRERIQ